MGEPEASIDKRICKSIQQQADPLNTLNPPISYTEIVFIKCACGKPRHRATSYQGKGLNEIHCYECHEKALIGAAKLYKEHHASKPVADVAKLLEIAASVANENASQFLKHTKGTAPAEQEEGSRDENARPSGTGGEPETTQEGEEDEEELWSICGRMVTSEEELIIIAKSIQNQNNPDQIPPTVFSIHRDGGATAANHSTVH